MLKRLRRKFIVIVMFLVGTVLVAVLGSTYVNAWQTQRGLVDESLNRGLRNDFGMGPGQWHFDQYSLEYWQDLFDSLDDMDGLDDSYDDGFLLLDSENLQNDHMRGGLLSMVLDVDQYGIIQYVNDAPVSLESSTIVTVVNRVLAGTQTEGYDTRLHVAWKSAPVGSYTRIALVDTSSSDSVLRTQAINDIGIVCAALVALAIITWWLSKWALRPVEEAWEQQRRFVADASHELKTPLAVILANTQILQKHEGVSDDAMRWVESTADEAEHMKALVGDLLQLARADESATSSSTNVMRHEDIDLSEMVEAASLEFDAVAFERGCMLDTQVDEGIHLTGDPEWVDRLVRILIDNACKYGEKGSTVTVRLAKVPGGSQLTVHNVGNPIDEEDLPHVFERFYRSDKARSRGGEGGFGLGLAIAKSIADAHGGTISVTSTEQEGTTFSVRF